MTTPKNPNRFNKWIFALACVGVSIAIISEQLYQATATCLQKQKVTKILEVNDSGVMVELDSGSPYQITKLPVKISDEVCIKQKP